MHTIIRIAVLVALLFALTIPNATAHTRSSGVHRTYETNSLCVTRETQLFHNSSNHKTTASQVSASQRLWVPTSVHTGFWKACSKTRLRPAGWLRTGSSLMKYRSSDRTWQVCRSQGWTYNNRDRHTLFTQESWGRACGSGDYRAWANGSVYFNGAWRGGGNIRTSTHSFSS